MVKLCCFEWHWEDSVPHIDIFNMNLLFIYQKKILSSLSCQQIRYLAEIRWLLDEIGHKLRWLEILAACFWKSLKFMIFYRQFDGCHVKQLRNYCQIISGQLDYLQITSLYLLAGDIVFCSVSTRCRVQPQFKYWVEYAKQNIGGWINCNFSPEM